MQQKTKEKLKQLSITDKTIIRNKQTNNKLNKKT